MNKLLENAIGRFAESARRAVRAEALADITDAVFDWTRKDDRLAKPTVNALYERYGKPKTRDAILAILAEMIRAGDIKLAITYSMADEGAAKFVGRMEGRKLKVRESCYEVESPMAVLVSETEYLSLGSKGATVVRFGRL